MAEKRGGGAGRTGRGAQGGERRKPNEGRPKRSAGTTGSGRPRSAASPAPPGKKGRGGSAPRANRAGSQPKQETPTQTVRLNKILADAGIASRRAADAMISAGRVKINGQVVTELGTKVSPYDRIMVDNKLIGEPERHVYMVLNKPKDTITTTSDERGRRTVLDLVQTEERIYPIGRLDRNTTGVLLLTNDGELANRLMHPSYGIERLYNVTLDNPLELKDARAIAAGSIDIGDGDITGQSEVSVDDRERTRVQILLREGKNREVRRLFEHFGYEVVRLDRKIYAGISARGLARGEARRLDRREISALRRLVDLE